MRDVLVGKMGHIWMIENRKWRNPRSREKDGGELIFRGFDVLTTFLDNRDGSTDVSVGSAIRCHSIHLSDGGLRDVPGTLRG